MKLLIKESLNEMPEDKEYLEQLLQYINQDLEKLKNNPDNFKMMAMMAKIPLDEYINKRIRDCEIAKVNTIEKLKK